MSKKHFVIAVSAILMYCTTVGQSFEGNWKGILDVQATELPLLFEFRYAGDWKGSMQSPKQAANRFPLSDIQTEGDSLFVGLKSMGIHYAGKMSQDRKAIHGLFTQGAMQTPLVLTRMDKDSSESTASNRTQRVTPPYDYDTLDVTFTSGVDQTVLAGTITRPRHAGRFAAVVLVTGSGPQDRNETIMGHEPFKVLADYLTKNDIIVLRYDDRGIGESKGDFAKATTGDFGQDALAALNFLKQQAKVDPMRVGLLGHSEGGLIATILAGQRASGLHFIASLAGPMIPMDSLLLLQNEAIMNVQGMVMSDSDRQMIKRNYELAASDLSARAAFDKILENMKSVSGSQDLEGADQIGAMVTPWFRHFIRIDPRPFIQKIQIPVYAAFGGKDVQVPAQPNIEALKKHLKMEENNRIKIYPEMNHLFQKAQSGSVAEYAIIEQTMDPEVLADLAQWIKSL